MTKEQYLDMCQQLGSEPIESEMPVELDDLPLEVQECLNLYKLLRDEYEYVGGNYIGKNILPLFNLLSASKVPEQDHKIYYEIISIFDLVRITESRKQKEKPAN